jgi:hypothetical protein
MKLTKLIFIMFVLLSMVVNGQEKETPTYWLIMRQPNELAKGFVLTPITNDGAMVEMQVKDVNDASNIVATLKQDDKRFKDKSFKAIFHTCRHFKTNWGSCTEVVLTNVVVNGGIATNGTKYLTVEEIDCTNMRPVKVKMQVTTKVSSDTMLTNILSAELIGKTKYIVKTNIVAIAVEDIIAE